MMRMTFRFHEQEIDLSQSVDEIRATIAQIMVERVNPDMSYEEALKIATQQITPFLTCPAQNNDRVTPAACMVCPTGHMTECHYPYSCWEAECSHYQASQEGGSY